MGGGKHAKHNKRKAAALRREVKRPLTKRKGGPERDVNVFKRRKFIKNNHIEPDEAEVGVNDTPVFLLNEYIVELNPANFNILNQILN